MIYRTSNYKAREYGITKLTTIKKALQLCPQVKIIDGSDLTHFRAASAKINEFWFSKLADYGLDLIEKKGFDECFLNITEVVKVKLKTIVENKIIFNGKVFGQPEPSISHKFLRIGSMIAEEWRKELFQLHGYTCCAGIATGKVAAKFAVNLNKPNGQAIFLPHYLEKFLADKPCRSIVS